MKSPTSEDGRSNCVTLEEAVVGSEPAKHQAKAKKILAPLLEKIAEYDRSTRYGPVLGLGPRDMYAHQLAFPIVKFLLDAEDDGYAWYLAGKTTGASHKGIQKAGGTEVTDSFISNDVRRRIEFSVVEKWPEAHDGDELDDRKLAPEFGAGIADGIKFPRTDLRHIIEETRSAVDAARADRALKAISGPEHGESKDCFNWPEHLGNKPHPKPVSPLDFEANPETIIFVNALGDIVLRSAEQILGGVDIGDAIEAAAAAAISANAAEVSADDAAASAAAAAASAVLAADATAILSTNPHFTGLPEFEGGLRVGKNGSGDSLVEFHDDNSDTWRSFWWDDDDNDWRVEDKSGSTRKLWHEGNAASQGEAEAGTENTKGMTALRVAQAIAALAGEGAFPAGTQLLCGNSTAPPGWVKKTDLNDYAIRLTSGPVGTSGGFGYSTVFASRTPTGVVGGCVLDTARIPWHQHSYVGGTYGNSVGTEGAQPRGTFQQGRTTDGVGGGGSHDHGFTGNPMPFNVYTRDVTMIEKT